MRFRQMKSPAPPKMTTPAGLSLFIYGGSSFRNLSRKGFPVQNGLFQHNRSLPAFRNKQIEWSLINGKQAFIRASNKKLTGIVFCRTQQAKNF
jgi:hypothetical protein